MREVDPALKQSLRNPRHPRTLLGGRLWVIDLVIGGERVLDLFSQKTCDLALALARKCECKEEKKGLQEK